MNALLEGVIFIIYSALFWAAVASGLAMIAVVVLGTFSTLRNYWRRFQER
jgi:hypothetical protein